MPTSPTPSAFKPSNSQDRNTIKIPDSQISNNDILHSDNEDQGLDSLETHSLSTTAPNLPNAVGLQRFPSPNVDPTRPTTPSNPQSISITTPYEEEPTEPPATASTNASTTATASNTTSLQLQAIDPPTTNSSNRTQASTIHPAPPPSADDNPPNDAATTALPPYDWHLLSTRYEAALAPLREQEDALTAEFEAWTKVSLPLPFPFISSYLPTHSIFLGTHLAIPQLDPLRPTQRGIPGRETITHADSVCEDEGGGF